MDVFNLRNHLIDDYRSYVDSFITISDDRVKALVEKELTEGILWPESLLQLNPAFEPGKWIDQLVQSQTLHTGCSDIFRIKSTNTNGKGLRLHKHQEEAIHVAQTGESYVLTTGTGSGKSLAYIIPIVDFVLKNPSKKGIKAVVVYPMNALANSQFKELEKFLCNGFPPDHPPVTFKSYTGQNEQLERDAIQNSPPDILLTNYVMLELLMTRPMERSIIDAAKGLQFLVLDELHTYRGRQGADVSMLVRRVRDVCENPALQCVGTSATLAGGGTFIEQQELIAAVASKIFGTSVRPTSVIGETLRRSTPSYSEDENGFVSALKAQVQQDALPSNEFSEFISDPISRWIETTFGLEHEPITGRLRRGTPKSISGKNGAASQLSILADCSEAKCADIIQRYLLGGYRVANPETNFPVFAFRLHQFISKGDTVYASPEPESTRYVTLQAQQYVPGGREKRLLPLSFCRSCGQEYYVVWKSQNDQGVTEFLPRELSDQNPDEGEECGFLYQSLEQPWPTDLEQILDLVPEDWQVYQNGVRQLKRDCRSKLPVGIPVSPIGKEDPNGTEFWYVKSPFQFCLCCGVSYSSRDRSDFGKLSSLSSEGRSTATTVLSLSCYLALRADETLDKQARKLLSFTDNRQDASLQAGHFNDFVQIGLLRGAIYRAIQLAGEHGLSHDELPLRVFEALNLPLDEYAINPEVKFHQKDETNRALRDVLGYYIYRDLKRGWRVTSPNLEQTGLLEIQYSSLTELCLDHSEWTGIHSALIQSSIENRIKVLQTLLDYLRKELAVKVDYLDRSYQERMQQRSSQHLIEPWAIEEQDAQTMTFSKIAFPRSRKENDFAGNFYVSGRGKFGIYLRRPDVLDFQQKLTLDDTDSIIRDLFMLLERAGLVVSVHQATQANDVDGYQVPSSAFLWKAGSGERPHHDPLATPRASREAVVPNQFFVNFYRNVSLQLQGIEAREHTAQVRYQDRQEREDRFREADLPIMFCSPTMELGVDISQLNAVNMRNVPPTPANYAQRSGRAGRSGQPALVYSYCTTGSPHDQYFFKRPERMVAGMVTPPRIDLTNEDLVRAHVHAVWLAETDLSLGRSLKDLLDVDGQSPSLLLKPSVKEKVENPLARVRALKRMQSIFLSMEDELKRADWYSQDWVKQTLDAVHLRFEATCDRWRSLYRAAIKQRDNQNAIIGDASRSVDDKNEAKRLRAEAEAQMELLTENDDIVQSDFYSYRYFASEGFLPGYNFPRLPLSAYIPGRKKRKSDRNEYISRPRFVAISEFGPRSILYHEGSRYLINKVILPVGEDILTSKVKLCPHCGYLHKNESIETGVNHCEYCGKPLDVPLHSLFRLQNVATKRRERINSDEEERFRLGYEIKTAVRFEEQGDRSPYKIAYVKSSSGESLFKLTFGQAATIWRINLGWRRRKDKSIHGFLLDTERGYWAKNETEDDSATDPISLKQERVIPYVEDRRNCLLIEPQFAMTLGEIASLQPALKSAIQAIYQLEDAELAAEPLPTFNDRKTILIYEAAEGGAGVLRQILDDNASINAIAREALQQCHYNAETGEDLRRAPHSREECEAACYDCLMSYRNQIDHRYLDRTTILPILLQLRDSVLELSPTTQTRQQHLDQLKSQCDTGLERKWLEFIESNQFHLPDVAQVRIEECGTHPDFIYKDEFVAIYVDGPVHETEDVARVDAGVQQRLAEHGWRFIRFNYNEDWLPICSQYPDVFGSGGQ